jgi:hypothetical protein
MMKQVNRVRTRHRGVFATAVFGTLVAAVAAQGVASAQTKETAIRTLGGPNRFSGPMHSVDDLRTMVTSNQAPINSSLSQAGLGDLATQFFNVVATGYVSDTTVAPGTHMDWMALKRTGRAGVLRNVRWTGSQPFDAFQFSVEYSGYNYTFVVPKICGNFALLSRAPVPVAVAPPPPPPPAPEPVVQAAPTPAYQPSAAQIANTGIETTDHWFASGYLGPNFGGGGSAALTNTNTGTTIGGFTNASSLSINFGGEIGYTFGGWIGAEFMANYAPNFSLNDALLTREPSVSAYMGNALFVVPTRGNTRFSPFVSGGIGAIHLQTNIFTVAPTATVVNLSTLTTVNVGGTQFGWDLGGGLFAFNGPWGLRADVRYYRATTNSNNDLSLNGLFLQRTLSGISFWNANFGLAFRW